MTDINAEINELLGTSVKDDLFAIRGRAEHLALLGYRCGDAVLGLAQYYRQHGVAPPVEHSLADDFADAINELENASRRYSRDTGRSDGAEIVFIAVARRVGCTPSLDGSAAADWVASSIERLREHRREKFARIAAERELG